MSDARERLLSSAGELIYALGYQGVSVEELCQRAGVKKGSFYHFFPSKQALTLAALDAQWNLMRDALVEPAFASDLPPLERIQRFFDSMAEASADEQRQTGQIGGCRFGNLVAEMGSQNPKIRQQVLSVFQVIATYFERALEEALNAGELSTINPRVTALALLGYMEGMLLLGRTYNDADLMRQLGQQALQFALARGAS
jgi:TetR/AcrR family transcriptional repressor of nem operon